MKIGRIEHRHALHIDVASVKRIWCLILVIDHALGLDLPQRRALAGLVADLAGAVDGALGDHGGAVDALGAGGGQPAILADQGAEAGQHAVAHLVGEHDMIGEGDIAACSSVTLTWPLAVTLSVFWS